MKKLIITFAVGLLIQQTIQAQGTFTYLSNLGQTSTGSIAIGSDSWLAADIITGNNVNGYELNSVQLAMADAIGNPSGFTIMVYSSGGVGGFFPGSNLDTLNGSNNPSTAGTYTYTPTSSLTLLPNTDYFIVLTAGTMVVNGAYEWNLASTYSYNASGGWGVGNNEGQVADYLQSSQGTSWIGKSGNIQFAITAMPVPEPSSFVLFGLSGLLFFRHRRRL